GLNGLAVLARAKSVRHSVEIDVAIPTLEFAVAIDTPYIGTAIEVIIRLRVPDTSLTVESGPHVHFSVTVAIDLFAHHAAIAIHVKVIGVPIAIEIRIFGIRRRCRPTLLASLVEDETQKCESGESDDKDSHRNLSAFRALAWQRSFAFELLPRRFLCGSIV